MLFVSCLRSAGLLTTEGENGKAGALLYRNFPFKAILHSDWIIDPTTVLNSPTLTVLGKQAFFFF